MTRCCRDSNEAFAKIGTRPKQAIMLIVHHDCKDKVNARLGLLLLKFGRHISVCPKDTSPSYQTDI